MKPCTKCGAVDFKFYKSKPERCKDCVKAKSRNYRKVNSSKCRAFDKNRYDDSRKQSIYFSQVQKKYGLSKEGYFNLLESQGGHCAICPSTERLVVEHNHATGEVRGIVCNKCNTALGMADDNVARLINLARYLTTNGHYG